MYKKYAQDIGITAFSNLMFRGLSLVLLALLTKRLGATAFGIWTQIFVTLSLFKLFSSLGLIGASFRFLPAQKDIARISREFSSVVSAVFTCSLLFSLIIVSFSNFLAVNLFRNAETAYFIRLAAFIIFFSACAEITLEYFRIYRRIKLHSFFTIARAILEIAFVSVLLYFGFGLTGTIVSATLSWGIILIAGLLLLFKEIDFCPPDFKAFKKYLKFGLPLLPGAFIMWIILSCDRYIIGYFLGSKSVGIYSAAYRIGNLAIFPLAAIESMLFIATAKLYDEGKIEEVKKHFRYSLKVFLMFAIPSAVGISLLAGPLIKLFSTKEFLYGIKALSLITFAVVGLGLYHIFILVLILAKKSSINLLFLSIAAVLNLGLNIFLVPRFGITGAGYATLCACIILALMTIKSSFRYLKFNLDLNFIVKALFASGLMGCIISILKFQNTMGVLVTVLAGALIYFLALFLSKGLNTQEIRFIRALLYR